MGSRKRGTRRERQRIRAMKGDPLFAGEIRDDEEEGLGAARKDLIRDALRSWSEGRRR